MKSFVLVKKATVPFAVAAVILAFGGFGPGALHAQTLLRATGTVYESSQNTNVRGVNGLFDGTPTAGSSANLGTIFDGSNNTANAAGGVDGDYNPIAAFDLGALYTVSSAGYAQAGPGPGLFNANSVTGSINVFTLSLAQYNNYITAAPLIASQTTGRAGRLVAAPGAGNFLTSTTITVTDLTDTTYNFLNLATPQIGQYFVLQFINNNPAYNSPANTAAFLGASEFEFRGVAAPEPTALVQVGLVVLGAAAFGVRRRLVASRR